MLPAPEAVLSGRRVLVTGASGLLGRAACARLLAARAEVVGTWRRRPPPAGVRALRAELPRDARDLMRDVRPEVVVHLAAPVDLRRDPALLGRLRPGILEATAELAEACLERSALLVHVGTCAEYGRPEQVPVAEDAAPRPVSPYGVLKLAATAWVQALARAHGLRAVVLRPFRVYGPGDESGLVGQAAAAAVAGRPFPTTDGRQVREWNHASAVAWAIVRAAADGRAVGRVLNVGGGPRLPVGEVVDRVFRLAGADPGLVRRGALPRRPGEPERFYGDHRAAEALWGPAPHPPLDEGLRTAIDWARARRAAGAAPGAAAARR